jgi:hypothetical protein
MTKIRYAFLMLAAAAVPVGCMPPQLNQPDVVSIGNPMPIVRMAQAAGATITLNMTQVTAGAFKTKAAPAKAVADVDFFKIELVDDAVGSPATNFDFANKPAIGPITITMIRNSVTLTGVAPANTFTDGTITNKLRFTNVPPGFTYRARVQAMEDPDNNWTTADAFPINKKVGSTGTDPVCVSTNTATAAVAPGNVTYSTGLELQVPVDLVDEIRDPADVQLTVSNGGAAGAIGFQDI